MYKYEFHPACNVQLFTNRNRKKKRRSSPCMQCSQIEIEKRKKQFTLHAVFTNRSEKQTKNSSPCMECSQIEIEKRKDKVHLACRVHK